ncbi:MAG TPA: sigma-70 family RNA polymerase sigma factor [Ktedonobacteraceae bacterium]|nr:sigma-70 family RNA polymerase sigma factor [Ktedonobacteraceae bacterium]
MEAIEQVLDYARQGNAEALSALYRRFLPGIFGYIATRVPDRATAEDLTSDVFLQMVEGIHRLKAKDEAGFTAWLLRIARVTVAGYYRAREKQPAHLSLPGDSWEDMQAEPLAVQGSDPEADPVQWTEAREEWQVVVSAINQLTEEQRQVLVGRLLLGYDVATVARMLGKQTSAVKALQFRALQSLQRLLGKSHRPLPALQQYKKEEGE